MYDNRRRSQWLDADEQPRNMLKQRLYPKKTIDTVWWSTGDVIHYNFLRKSITFRFILSRIKSLSTINVLQNIWHSLIKRDLLLDPMRYKSYCLS